MTEKRFELGKSENQDTIFDNESSDDYYHLGNDTEDVKALCKLLNELHEENQLNKLQEENKQLKKIIKENSKTINQLSEENQQLKETVQLLIKKEFAWPCDDNDYDPLNEFFKNEVPISQIEVEIDVEKKD